MDDPSQEGVTVRLPFRLPFDADGLLTFLGQRAVPGVEEVTEAGYRRSLRLPHGQGTVTLLPSRDHILARFELEALVDLDEAVQRCRRLLDLDADPVAVVDVLGTDPVLAALVARSPGRRSPGSVDGAEMAVRAVVGQQVSVAGARTVAGRLVAAHGRPLAAPDGGLTHLFPDAETLANADPATLPMPAARQRALQGLCAALAAGHLDLDAGADRHEVERRLLDLPGIGPWTVAYLSLRALRDPDAFPATDLGVRHAAAALGLPEDPRELAAHAERWRPWRSYATHHLWASLNAADNDAPFTPSVRSGPSGRSGG